MWIERHIQGLVERAFSQFPILVITGARQTGKVSLLRQLFPSAHYVTLDIPREAELARLDFPAFLRRHEAPLIVDEIQYAPEVLRLLKNVVDADPRPERYVLAGSQGFGLMTGGAESLAGRCAVLSLSTLCLTEVDPRATANKADLFAWRGGFPALWQRPTFDRDLWLGSYLATFLERDVRNILNVGSLRDFDRFLRAAASRVGQLLSLSDLARDVGISPNTAKSWLSTLETSGQVFLLDAYHVSGSKKLTKTPKLYFWDSGLLTYMLGFADQESMVRNAMWGVIWENLVISEVHKHFLNRGRRPPCSFWRTTQGEEVELLVEVGPFRLLAIACSPRSTVTPGELKGLDALNAAYGPDVIEKAAVICRTDQAYPLAEGGRVMALPLGGADGLSQWLPRSQS